MYSRSPRRLVRPIGLAALPVLVLLSACSPDKNIGPPAAPDAVAPLSDADLSRHNCFVHHDDCALPKNGRIAFSRYIPFTGFGIFSAAPDGSELTQLTTPTAGVFDDFAPDWSPDGTNIIFERDYNDAAGTHQLFRANADGTGLHQLMNCIDRCLGVSDPVYSPDGRRIAFDEANGDESAVTVAIWVMRADGSNALQVTQRTFNTGSEDHETSWSPDGRRIAFTRSDYAAGKQAVFVSNADGTDEHRITPWQLNAWASDWSPDGRLILISSHFDIEPPGKEQLYTVHPDGSGLTRLAPAGFDQPLSFGGKFSPDGRKIVFLHQAGTADGVYPLVYTMDLDGRNVVQISHDSQFYATLAWGTHR